MRRTLSESSLRWNAADGARDHRNGCSQCSTEGPDRAYATPHATARELYAGGDRAFRAAIHYARQLGLPPREWDDCAADFRLALLERFGKLHIQSLESEHPRLLMHIARQYVFDYRKRLYRRREQLDADLGAQTVVTVRAAILPPVDQCYRVITTLTWERRFALLQISCSNTAIRIFLDRLVLERPWNEIAADYNMYPATVRQVFSRMVKRLNRIVVLES